MKTILIVDDEQGMREVLAEDLTYEGYKIHTAHSGKSAIEVFKNNQFNIVISDLKMPDGDGRFLLSEVRKINPEIPFIIVSGFLENIEEELRSLGVTHILRKPYKMTELMKLITA